MRVDGGLHGGGVADVGLDLDRPPPERLDLQRRRVGRHLRRLAGEVAVRPGVDVEHGHVGAERRQVQRVRPPQPAPATGHQRALPLQAHRGRTLRSAAAAVQRTKGSDMTTSPLQEERRVADAIVDVLAEAGVGFVLGMPGGYTGPIFSSLHGHPTIRTIQVREESIGATMAEAYGRLTGRPLVVMGQGEWIAGNAGQGFLEALLGSSPIVILTEMSDGGALSHHAPYQSGTGDYGTWDARGALAGVTKRVMVSHDPAQAVQHTQLALKHALTGEPGPGRRDLPQHARCAAGSGPTRRRGSTRPRRTCRARPTPSTPTRWPAAVAALDGAARPVIIAGNGVRVGQACAAAGRAGPGPRRPGRHDGQRQGRVRRDRSARRRRDGQLRLAERQRGRRRRRRRARRRHQARPPRHRRRARRPARPEPPDADPDRHRAAQRGVDVPRRPRPRRRRRRRARPPARRRARRRRRAGDRRRPRRPRRSAATTSSARPSSRPTTCRCCRSASSASSTRRSPTTPRHLRRRREPAVHDALVPLEDARRATSSRPPAAAWATPCRRRWRPSWPTPTARRWRCAATAASPCRSTR